MTEWKYETKALFKSSREKESSLHAQMTCTENIFWKTQEWMACDNLNIGNPINPHTADFQLK